MKELIDLSRKITESPLGGKAVVKSKSRSQSVIDGSVPVGIYYEGKQIPLELSQYIGENDVDMTIWESKCVLKVFIS